MTGLGLRSIPARIDSTKLVQKNAAARIAVVRVSTLEVPRLDRNAAGRAYSEPTPFRFLQQHDADHGGNDHEMNKDDHGLHESARMKACGTARRPASSRFI